MTNFLLPCAIAALFAVVVSHNGLKTEVRELERELGSIEAQIAGVERGIRTLEADLSHLRRPQRLSLQAPAIGMEPARGERIVTVAELPSAARLGFLRTRIAVPLEAGASELRARPDTFWSDR